MAEVGSGAWQAAKLAQTLCVAGWSSVATAGVLTALGCTGLPTLTSGNTWVSVNIPGAPQAPGLGFAITNTKALRTDGLNGLTLVHDLSLVGYLVEGVPDGMGGVNPLLTVGTGDVFDQQYMERAINGWSHIAAILLASPIYGLVNYSARTPSDTSGVFNFDPDDAFAPAAAESNIDQYLDSQETYIRVFRSVGRIYQRTLLPPLAPPPPPP